MKKVLLLSLLILFFTGCSRSDASRFKKEYESLNGTLNSNNQAIREVFIPKNNPFIYKSASDIVEMIENKESFIVYFGFAKCPWCRSVLKNLIKAAEDSNLKKIYYVDVLEIRDTLKLENGEIVKVSDGTEDYHKLVSLISDVLSDYKLKEKDEVKVVGKRIYAPNVVAIKNGKAISMTEGISESQNDAYMTLTDEMNKESYNMFKNVIMQLETCDDKC